MNQENNKLKLVSTKLKTIGRRDHIDLPELDLNNLIAKIDTGAYGCSIHCHDVEVVSENGHSKLRFRLLDPTHPEYADRYIYFVNFGEKEVKNSSGTSEMRFTIKTPLQIFGKQYLTEFSLTDREQMKYPVLIGRKFLSKKFIVNVSKKDLSYKQSRKL